MGGLFASYHNSWIPISFTAGMIIDNWEMLLFLIWYKISTINNICLKCANYIIA